jgi:hypothetical protein
MRAVYSITPTCPPGWFHIETKFDEIVQKGGNISPNWLDLSDFLPGSICLILGAAFCFDG